MATPSLPTPALRQRFRRRLLAWYNANGRDLPLRCTDDPYHILVSEVMLQQTQVSRVIPFYKNFLRRFPDARALARAPLSQVLTAWQGLGYNRRAKYLHEAAKRWGTVELEALPGVGPYTANAVRVFAFNEPRPLIETNIRAAYLHHFFPRSRKVPDSKLLPLIAIPKGIEPRVWYSALMDYGAHLKSAYPNPSRRSKHHVKQKPFTGSDREIRGAILRSLAGRGDPSALRFPRARLRKNLHALTREGLIQKARNRYRLAR